MANFNPNQPRNEDGEWTIAGDAAREAAGLEEFSDLWELSEQEFASSKTSINAHKLPSIFNKVEWKSGTRNADIGGGRYDNVTEYLRTKGVENVIYDPFNRTLEHNLEAVEKIQNGQCDTVTVSNVLNVIKERINRSKVIKQAENCLKLGGTAYFQIYEGSGSGVGKETSAGWQNNSKTIAYMSEISRYFLDVQRKENFIIAKNPRSK